VDKPLPPFYDIISGIVFEGQVKGILSLIVSIGVVAILP
jgi:hypothetical protein